MPHKHQNRRYKSYRPRSCRFSIRQAEVSAVLSLLLSRYSHEIILLNATFLACFWQRSLGFCTRLTPFGFGDWVVSQHTKPRTLLWSSGSADYCRFLRPWAGAGKVGTFNFLATTFVVVWPLRNSELNSMRNRDFFAIAGTIMPLLSYWLLFRGNTPFIRIIWISLMICILTLYWQHPADIGKHTVKFRFCWFNPYSWLFNLSLRPPLPGTTTDESNDVGSFKKV